MVTVYTAIEGSGRAAAAAVCPVPRAPEGESIRDEIGELSGLNRRGGISDGLVK